MLTSSPSFSFAISSKTTTPWLERPMSSPRCLYTASTYHAERWGTCGRHWPPPFRTCGLQRRRSSSSSITIHIIGNWSSRNLEWIAAKSKTTVIDADEGRPGGSRHRLLRLGMEIGCSSTQSRRAITLRRATGRSGRCMATNPSRKQCGRSGRPGSSSRRTDPPWAIFSSWCVGRINCLSSSMYDYMSLYVCIQREGAAVIEIRPVEWPVIVTSHTASFW